jgi:hypothetical protein
MSYADSGASCPEVEQSRYAESVNSLSEKAFHLVGVANELTVFEQAHFGSIRGKSSYQFGILPHWASY